MEEKLQKLVEKFRLTGQKKEARMVQKLVKTKSVTLCILHDEDCNVEKELKNLGLVGIRLSSPRVDLSGLYTSYCI